MIRDKSVFTVQGKLQEILLREDKLSLDKAIIFLSYFHVYSHKIYIPFVKYLMLLTQVYLEIFLVVVWLLTFRLFIFMCHFIDWRARAETISSQSARKSM
jgi:hypothetical protein